MHCFSLDLPAQQFTLTATLEVKQQGIADVCIRQDQRLFATAGWDGKIRVFHYKKQKTLAVLQVSFVVSFSCARACDIITLNQLCTFCEAATAALSFIAEYRQRGHMQSLLGHVSIGQTSCDSPVCFGADCCLLTLMVVGSNKKFMLVLKHACVFAMQYHKKGLTALAFDSRGQRLVSASRDGNIALWSVFQSDSV